MERLAGGTGRLAGVDDDHARARAAYAQLKRAIIRMAQGRAPSWGTGRANCHGAAGNYCDTYGAQRG